MYYKEFKEIKLSALGMGGMRFPCKDGNDSVPDREKVNQLIDYSLENGINYFDTGWGYHGGNSEKVLGEALRRHKREFYYIASKFPGYFQKYFGKVEHVFEEQLCRCGLDFFDFYLLHNVWENNIEDYLNDKEYGTISYLREQKRNGRIKHLGMSTHGTVETVERFLKEYGEDIDFVQIQLNWFDYEYQNAKGMLELLKAYEKPVFVMEPLRGGRLCALDEKYLSKLSEAQPEWDEIEWAFRFLQAIPGVTMVLSGMSSLNQVKRNCELFRKEQSVSLRKFGILEEIAKEMAAESRVPCTACKYCIKECPMQIEIPNVFAKYTEYMNSIGAFSKDADLKRLKATSCIGCKRCEKVCPQKINISALMQAIKSSVEKRDVK